MEDDGATECRYYQSGFILKYQQLYNRYTLCLAHLQESIKEVDALRQENESLRLANAELVDRLSLLSQTTIQNCLLSDFNRLNITPSPSRDPRVTTTPFDPSTLLNITNTTSSPTTVIQQNRLERRHIEERGSLPKSISVRSSGYLKVKPQSVGKNGAPSQVSSCNRVNSPSVPESEKAGHRVYVAGAEGARDEEEALELDVYNQGMLKTELCNKWQETGKCPYGENCQFAHGITELRPVIRHPRYKTEVCRLVLAGDICPYGHRCHFRHSLASSLNINNT
ncbi:hypothetical protein ACH5RR_011664 [Cinchona calisaya]|uniref:C3H1-type domain-containing protein n=1 Tax=Cinchona calisaya TaxID=153742 RepID=A0ABD3A659_9GENT